MYPYRGTTPWVCDGSRDHGSSGHPRNGTFFGTVCSAWMVRRTFSPTKERRPYKHVPSHALGQLQQWWLKCTRWSKGNRRAADRGCAKDKAPIKRIKPCVCKSCRGCTVPTLSVFPIYIRSVAPVVQSVPSKPSDGQHPLGREFESRQIQTQTGMFLTFEPNR